MPAELDERILCAFDEPPGVVRHGMPPEQRAQHRAEAIAVGATGPGSDQFGFDRRTDADKSGPDGADPPRLDVLAATKAYEYRLG